MTQLDEKGTQKNFLGRITERTMEFIMRYLQFMRWMEMRIKDIKTLWQISIKIM